MTKRVLAHGSSDAARRATAAIVLMLIMAAALGLKPGVARAGQIVYASGTGIWAMNDDGSNQHELVDATQVPGVEYIGNPSVQGNGTLVAFTGEWSQAGAEEAAYGPGFCGGNCEAVYELQNGTVTRITGAPFDCPAQRACASYEFDPRVASDGSVAYVFQTWLSEPDPFCTVAPCRNVPVVAQSALLSRDSAGNNQQQWQPATSCTYTTEANEQATNAAVLAPNPQNPSQIAYGPCPETSQASCDWSWTTAWDTYSSGANRADVGDDVKLASDPDPNANCFQDASTQAQDLDYSPDGSTVVEIHGASGAGIYSYPAAGGGPATELLAIPDNWCFWSVRYLGPNRLGLVAGVGGCSSESSQDVYAFSTSCTPATCNIATGLGVAKLTSDGKGSHDSILNTANFGYTSSTTAITPVGGGQTGGGQTGGGQTGGGQTGGGQTGGSQTGGTFDVTVAGIRRQKLARVRAHGIRVRVTCASACSVKATITLGARDARRWHLLSRSKHHAPKQVVIGSGRGSFATGTHELLVRLRGVARRKLAHARRLKVTLRLVATGAGGARSTITRRITIVR